MIVWTVQPKTALEDIEKYGYFRCDESKSYNLTKSDSLKPQYQWLIGKMKEKIGEPPEGVEYPIWAWHIWEYEHRQPDVDSAAFTERDYETVTFTLDIPENELVLTDFEAWQIAMNGWYLSYETDDKKLDKFLDSLFELPEEEQREIIMKSWENVFLTDRFETENFTRGMYVQATFWEIKREYIVNVA